MKNLARVSLSILLLSLAGSGGFIALAAECAAQPVTTSPDGFGAQPLFGHSLADYYAVDHYVFDSVLKRSWAVLVDCHHPERPPSLVPVSGSLPALNAPRGNGFMDERGRDKNHLADAARTAAASSSLSRIWVIAGAEVHVWSGEGNEGHLELSGVATRSAPLGKEVTVRVGELMEGSVGVLLRGIVRDAHSVELLPSISGWNSERTPKWIPEQVGAEAENRAATQASQWKDQE